MLDGGLLVYRDLEKIDTINYCTLKSEFFEFENYLRNIGY